MATDNRLRPTTPIEYAIGGSVGVFIVLVMFAAAVAHVVGAL